MSTAKSKKSSKHPRAMSSSWRLSDLDVHYLVGFLHLITKREHTVLGERILDTTTGTLRDVDIVIAGTWGALGVEVKDKGRPLDVGIVEGICQKFADMPQLTERAIVSSSDYTEPARSKARAHGVKCLRFVRGHVPRSFDGTDLSTLRELVVTSASWRRPPVVTVVTSAGIQLHLPKSTMLIGPESGPRTLAAMIDAAPARAEGQSGPIDLVVRTAYPLAVRWKRALHEVAEVRFEGDLVTSRTSSPLRCKCYLADEAGDAIAAAVIFDYGRGLLGVATTAGKKLSIVPIPQETRLRRPHRFPIT